MRFLSLPLFFQPLILWALAGYKPFVDECLARTNRFEAKKYVPKLPLEERLNVYVDMQSVAMRACKPERKERGFREQDGASSTAHAI